MWRVDGGVCAYYELGEPEQKNAFELSHVVSATVSGSAIQRAHIICRYISVMHGFYCIRGPWQVKRYEEKPGLKNRLMSVGAEVSRHTHARLDIYLHF